MSPIWFIFSKGRGCCQNFATGLNIIISHSSKSIWVIKLSICQNDPSISKSFWKKDSLITHILSELWLIMILSPVATFGHHPLELRCIFHSTHVFTYYILSYPKKYFYSVIECFPSYNFFHIMKKKLFFSKFQKSSHFHSDFKSIRNSRNNLNFEKKINSISYLIWNSISEETWLFHDSKGLTHTFCMWYSRTGMCMYSVVYSNRYTTYIHTRFSLVSE